VESSRESPHGRCPAASGRLGNGDRRPHVCTCGRASPSRRMIVALELKINRSFSGGTLRSARFRAGKHRSRGQHRWFGQISGAGSSWRRPGATCVHAQPGSHFFQTNGSGSSFSIDQEGRYRIDWNWLRRRPSPDGASSACGYQASREGGRPDQPGRDS
jgi:hypothetical protein